MSQCQAGPSGEISSRIILPESVAGQGDSVRYPSQLSRCSMSSESSNCSTTPLVSSKIATKYSSVQRSYTQLDDNSCEEPEKFKSISTKLLCASCATFFASSLPSGYNLGVVNTPQDILKNFCNESVHNKSYDLSPDQLDLLWSAVVSIFLIGSMIGSAMSAWSSSLFGRRMTVILSSLLALTGAVAFVLSKLTDSVSLIVVGRVLSGIHCGLSSSLVPMYLMELSPCDFRQAVGILHCLGMTVGILVAQILGQETILGTDEHWPYLLSLYALFILFGFILLINTPESPVYLFMDCENEFDALQVLQQVYGNRPEEVLSDFYEMQREKKLRESEPAWSMLSTVLCPSLRRSLFLVCILHIGQQFSGINAVFYYSTQMFMNVGFNDVQSQVGSILVAAVNVLVSILAIPVVNTFSKRTLMTFSSLSSALFLVALTASSYFQPMISECGLASIVFVMSYVFVYGFGLGPIPYTIGSDLFDSGPRPFGMSLGCLCNWTCNFIIAMTFTILDKVFGYYTYLLFAGSCLIISVISLLYLGESKDIELLRSQSSAKDLGIFNRNISNVSEFCSRDTTSRITRISSVCSSVIEF